MRPGEPFTTDGIIGYHRVPAHLRRRMVKDEQIISWARTELRGLEPALTKSEIDKIKASEIDRVFLKPKKPGFFLPDGTFVEAFDYSPGFGDDLKDAVGRWDVEQSNREWADKENSVFNKGTASGDPRFPELLWEHGRRIHEFAASRQVPPSRFLLLLDRRSARDSYRRHTHQTALDFYKWVPEREMAFHYFGWRWERIDCVIRFSTTNEVRDHVANLLETTKLGRLPDDRLSRLLGIKTRRVDQRRTPAEDELLKSFRRRLKLRETPPAHEIESAIEVVMSKEVTSGES